MLSKAPSREARSSMVALVERWSREQEQALHLLKSLGSVSLKFALAPAPEIPPSQPICTQENGCKPASEIPSICASLCFEFQDSRCPSLVRIAVDSTCKSRLPLMRVSSRTKRNRLVGPWLTNSEFGGKHKYILTSSRYVTAERQEDVRHTREEVHSIV